MFRRVLAFVMAGLLVFESAPVTSYATALSTETVSENSETETSVESAVLEDAVPMDGGDVVGYADAGSTDGDDSGEGVGTDDGDDDDTDSSDNAIKYGKVNQITLQGRGEGNTIYQWYSFKAPANGYYDFKITKTEESSSGSYFALYTEVDGSEIKDVWISNQENTEAHLITREMKKGETLWLRGYTYSDEDVSLSIEVQKPVVYALVKQEDGSYIAQSDTYTFSLDMEVGYEAYRADVALTPKEGQTLDSYYRLRSFRSQKGSDYESGDSYYLYSPGYTNEVSAHYLNMDTEYSFYYVLEEYYTQAPLAVFDGDITVKTKKTDEAIVINEVTSTENSITLDVETFEDFYCYYVPTDGTEEERSQSGSKGWYDFTLENLQEGTEYNIEFTDCYGNTVYTTKASTKTCSAVVDYSVSVAEDFTSFTVKADVSGYKGDATYAQVHYYYTDEFGKVRSDYGHLNLREIEAAEDGSKSFVVENVEDMPVLKAGKAYEITMYLSLGGIRLKKVVKEVTAPVALLNTDDITLSATTSSTSNTTADVSIQVAKLEKNVEAELYYKQHGNEEGYSRTERFTISDTSEMNYSISNLEAGATYDFALVAGGTITEISAVIGEASVKLTQVGETEVNAYDLVRTYKVESSEELAETYYLKMYYFNDNGYYTQWGSYITLNADNMYEDVYKSAMNNTALKPDTDYKVKWTLCTSTYSSATPLVTVYETLHTATPDVTFEETTNSYNKQEYKVTLNKESVANFTYFPSINLRAYIRKKGATAYRQTSSFYLYANDDGSTLALEGLEPETGYEVSVRDNNGIEYTTLSFTTTADNREISIDSVSASFHSAQISTSVSGVGKESGYVHAFIREKGTEDAWESADYSYFWEGYSHLTLYINDYKDVELKEDTTYEFILGFNSNWSVRNVNELEKTITSEFTTKKDMRSITGVVSAGYASAKMQANFSGNNGNVGSYIHYFYKAKDAEKWIRYDYTYTNSVSITDSTTVTGLSTGTTYDYAIVISDKYNCESPDEVVNELRKVEGEFTTKSNTYTLDFALNDSKTTSDKAVVAVTAKGDAGDSRVDVTLTLSDGQEQTVSLRQSTGYTKNVTFRDLMGSTEYTITNAAFSVKENDYTVEIGEIACNFKFTTKEAEVPTAITLAEEKIFLNAAYANSTLDIYDAIGYKAIKAEVTPATAADDFVYTSSDEAVATVSADGVVYAKNAGTATITVASVYDANVKATCTVEVKKYAIGWVHDNDSVYYVDVNPYYPTYYHVYKGNALTGYGLYEMNADNQGTLLSDFAVSFERENIATWTNGNIQSMNVGETGVIFEKDGVKAKMLVTVAAAGKGFGITGFESSDYSYPAIKNADGSYTLVNFAGITYEAKGEISPSNYFNASDFTWSISDETIASVNEYGVITPLKDGKVTLTVTPVNYQSTVPYIQDKVEVVLNIKGLPIQGENNAIYAIANVSNTIGDVAFPESWGEGWSWKFPNTPLVTNGVNSNNYYYFDAVYNGNNGYPIETELMVYIGKITGAYVYETDGNHNNVVEVNNTDSIRISVRPAFQGLVTNSAYTVEIPAVDGLTITEASDFYTVTAQKAGKYTLEPVVKVGNQVVATTKYTINAVSEKQVANIQITSDTEGVTVEGNKIIFDSIENKKDFALKATVTDRQGETLTTALQWKTSDKKVAAVTADKTNTQNAKVVTKESGHATIVVKAKDATGYQVELDVEVQDHSPRVNTNKATVNIAYDYNDYSGQSLASAAGLVEIVPVYGEYISNIKVLDKVGEKVETNLELVYYGNYTYLVRPTTDVIPTGKYACTIRVTTSEGREYDYPLTVTVVEKKPTVSAKKCSTINLFFTETTGRINLKVSNNARISSTVWVDKSEGVGNGFAMNGYYTTSSGKYVNYITVSQEDNLAVVNGALQDTSVAEGTLTVKLYGYKEAYTLNNVKVMYNYKKPTIITQGSSSNVIPSIGQTAEDFGLYDKTNKRWLYYNYDYGQLYTYEEITCEDDDITLRPSDNSAWVSYRYDGKETQKKITLDIDSSTWREPLQTTHTIKVISPKAYLGTKQLTYNNAVKNTLYSYVYLNGTFNIDKYADIVISGANPKSQELLDKDLFIATFNGYNGITFKQSDASLMNTTIPKGTYSYKVTPYVKNVETGEKVALNTLTLKIKVVDKPITAKISPKGSIDLANGSQYSTGLNKNIVYVEPKFSNIMDGYYIGNAKLVGEYSDYFYLYQRSSKDYIRIQSSAVGKLKAGQTYKLAIEYTLYTNDGDEIIVTSNTFNIKPKQSKPKVTIGNNNQTLYAAADNVSRTYYLYVPSYYSIESAYGSIDCNKDGKADITVSNSGGSYTTVRIVDKDAVIATTKGKSYSIPVTVRVTGRDGIAQDATVKIKVTVKR